jgi:cardiolipin synthase
MTDGTLLAAVATGVVVLAVAGVVLTLATDDREPSIVLAWLFLLVIVPVVGVVAYFFVGRNFRRATRRRGRRDEHDHPDPAEPDPLEPADDSPAHRMERIARREAGAAPVPARDVRVYFTGADKFRDLLADLRGARRTVHLMYLIWERDELTAQVTEILLDRLGAGVRVYVLYDWLSSLPYRKSELRRLAAAGAAVVPCYRNARQLNYRNHMKMAVVDGDVVYSGGMNMGQEYVDGGPRFDTWRDTHVRMRGPVAAPYLSLFASTWRANDRDDDVLEAVPAPPASIQASAPAADQVKTQVVHSSVSTPSPAIRNLFIVALTSARRRVWVQSPYFVPDEPLLTAMCVAAASGVDVRFMMTGHPDKKVPFYAAHTYFAPVLDAGGRIFTYQAGFLHSKTVTVDDDLVVIGTCNWDIRSLILHDEVVSVFHDEALARLSADQYAKDQAECRELTADDVRRLSGPARVRNSLCRLTSRLL